jgi:hypothetical protein
VANARKWWARAEREAPRELELYRRARTSSASKKVQRAALERLKEVLR